MAKRERGFTLSDLLIAAAIVGILASFAIPGYVDAIRKGRRSDAITSLLQLQQAQEKYRTNHTIYGPLSTVWAGSDSLEGYYTMAVVANSANTYIAAATPKGDGPQASDSCGAFAVNPEGAIYSAAGISYADQACWKR